MEELEKIFEEIEGGMVLDLATGGGDFLRYIAGFRNVEKVIAIDQVDRMKDLVEKNKCNLNVEFRQMDACQLDFEDCSFDTVCLSNSLHHLENHELVFSQINRVLKSEGCVIINEMVSDDLTQAQESHKLIHHFAADLDQLEGVPHRYTYSRSEINEILEKSPFKVEKFSYYTLPMEDCKAPDLLEYFRNYLEKLALSMDNRNIENKESYKDRLKKIGDYIKENGYAPASSVFYVLKK